MTERIRQRLSTDRRLSTSFAVMMSGVLILSTFLAAPDALSHGPAVGKDVALQLVDELQARHLGDEVVGEGVKFLGLGRKAFEGIADQDGADGEPRAQPLAQDDPELIASRADPLLPLPREDHLPAAGLQGLHDQSRHRAVDATFDGRPQNLQAQEGAAFPLEAQRAAVAVGVGDPDALLGEAVVAGGSHELAPRQGGLPACAHHPEGGAVAGVVQAEELLCPGPVVDGDFHRRFHRRSASHSERDPVHSLGSQLRELARQGVAGQGVEALVHVGEALHVEADDGVDPDVGVTEVQGPALGGVVDVFLAIDVLHPASLAANQEGAASGPPTQHQMLGVVGKLSPID